MASLRQNLTWAWRTMRRYPGFTAVVVLSLGLAIGTNTAVFSVVDSFLLRPLPIRDLDRVVKLYENLAEPGQTPDFRSLWGPNYYLWKEHNQVFAGMGAARPLFNMNLTGTTNPQRVQAAGVTWDFFPLLGVQPAVGRPFTPEEDRPGRNRTALLSHTLWESRYGSDRQILGKPILVNGEAYTVVGIMPPHFRFPYNSEIWIPLADRNDPTEQPDWEIYCVARLKPGVTVERANTEMGQLVSRLQREHPLPSPPKSAYINPLRKELIQNLDRLLYVLSAAAFFLLLIACANTSNLLLAQSVNKSNEVAIRSALGASRKRIVGQFFTYSALLALAGGVLGLLLTSWSLKSLVALSPLEQPITAFDVQPALDLSTLGFTVLLSLLVGGIFGLVPALRVSTGSLSELLKAGDRSRTLGSEGRRLLGSFVTAQVALAVILLLGAGLTLRSFRNVFGADRGFAIDKVLTFDVSFSSTKYPELHQKTAFVREAVARLQAVPGVAAVATTTTQPVYAGQEYAAFNVEGKPADTEAGYYVAHTRTITPDYFKVLSIPLLEGRRFTEADNETSLPVVIVSRSFANKYWPGQSPLGKRVKRGLYDAERPWLTVVGVVRTLSETTDEQNTHDAWYLPYSQTTMPNFTKVTFSIKTLAEPKGLIPQVRKVILGLDPDQPIFDVQTMAERLAHKTAPDRFSALLYGLMGSLGLVLAAIGIYGAFSFSVNERRREMGIRMALGARPGQIQGMVVRQALALTAIGLLVGSVGALYLSRFLASHLHEISARDPLTLGLVLALLIAAALLSSYLPARRASGTDPVTSLRFQ